MELDVQRFRPNLLIEAIEDSPFQEVSWVVSAVRIGDMRIRIDQGDSRCAVITVDPVTAERSPKILRAVVNDQQGCLGVYAWMCGLKVTRSPKVCTYRTKVGSLPGSIALKLAFGVHAVARSCV